MIDVCCAIILNGDKILAVQRGPESSHPMKWEFPGGKIQKNETAEESVVREIQEELSVQIEELFPVEPVGYDYGTKQIRLIPFVCSIQSGNIILTEHVSMRWFELDEWEDIDWAAADYELILKNRHRLQNLF